MRITFLLDEYLPLDLIDAPHNHSREIDILRIGTAGRRHLALKIRLCSRSVRRHNVFR
jgi:hypothetical protein